MSGEHVVRRHRSPDPLERELTNRLDRHGILNRHQHPGADKDLTGLGFVAKARGNIRHCPYRGIVETSFETDGAERGRRTDGGRAGFHIGEARPGGTPSPRHPTAR